MKDNQLKEICKEMSTRLLGNRSDLSESERKSLLKDCTCKGLFKSNNIPSNEL